MDKWVTDELRKRPVCASLGARRSTETSGTLIDRMSILARRIDHLEAEATKEDATTEHLEEVQAMLTICLEQLGDLSEILGELLEDIFADRGRPETSRHLKMYNDLDLNSHLYRTGRRKAG